MLLSSCREREAEEERWGGAFGCVRVWDLISSLAWFTDDWRGGGAGGGVGGAAGREMAGKGGKGLLAAKTTAAKAAADKDKDKKKAPVSRSSRAGIQVPFPSPLPSSPSDKTMGFLDRS